MRSSAALLLPLSGNIPPYRPLPCTASESSSISSAAALLTLIPDMAFSAPATNSTLPAALVREIEAGAVSLERLDARGLARDGALNGSWRLLYSNAREISNLASGLPLGFALGPTYQPIDVATGRFENQGTVVHKLGIARASTCVVGDVRVAPLGTLNAAGTRNDAGNRVDVDFRRITFGLDEILGRPVAVQKVLVPSLDASASQPANDITYLDCTLRITRGGDDALFIFRREESSRPLLTHEQREQLYSRGGGAAVKTATGEASDTAPPELRRLLKRNSH